MQNPRQLGVSVRHEYALLSVRDIDEGVDNVAQAAKGRGVVHTPKSRGVRRVIETVVEPRFV